MLFYDSVTWIHEYTPEVKERMSGKERKTNWLNKATYWNAIFPKFCFRFCRLSTYLTNIYIENVKRSRAPDCAFDCSSSQLVYSWNHERIHALLNTQKWRFIWFGGWADSSTCKPLFQHTHIHIHTHIISYTPILVIQISVLSHGISNRLQLWKRLGS